MEEFDLNIDENKTTDTKTNTGTPLGPHGHQRKDGNSRDRTITRQAAVGTLEDTQVGDGNIGEGMTSGGAAGDGRGGSLVKAMSEIALRRKPLSGAARRKLKKAREAAAGKPSGSAGNQGGGDGSGGQGPRTKTKRQRESKDTPPTDRRDRKRPRAAGTERTSFAAVVSNLPRLAIIQAGLREEITKEQSILVQEGLMGIVDEIPCGGFIPRFQETYLHRGVLKVVCADQQTATWLRDQVVNLRKWEGADLQVVDMDDLPKYVRVMAWLPGPAVETATALKRLEKQNPGLRTDRWVIHERQEDPSKGVRLVLGVEDKILPVLQALAMRPYLGMGRAVFQLLGARPKEDTQNKGEDVT